MSRYNKAITADNHRIALLNRTFITNHNVLVTAIECRHYVDDHKPTNCKVQYLGNLKSLIVVIAVTS